MKIIVGGAGSVGKSIVSYLVKGNNDIIVIDNNQSQLDEIAKEFDVLPILGEVSHPSILERAGAAEADLLVAVTNIDEVNMVCCQVAHTLFHVPKKIARISSEDFLDSLWSPLYNDNNFPIDLVISPNIEIAEDILRIIKYSGSAGIWPILSDKANVIALKVSSQCPLINTPFMHFERVIPNLDIALVAVVRDFNCFIPQSSDSLLLDDELYVLVKGDNIKETLQAFGIEYPSNERIVIFGGNKIASYIANKLEHDDSIISCKIIEEDYETAKKLARDLSHVVVIHGPLMSDVILSEASITQADTSIAVTAKDKDNLLASLLAKKSGVFSTISVVNTPSYNNLIVNIGDNILVDRASVTLSKMLKEIRKTKISEAYSIGRGLGEIWEIKLDVEDSVVNKTIADLDLPNNSKIFAIMRENGIFYPDSIERLLKDDVLLLYVDSNFIKKAEKIFS